MGRYEKFARPCGQRPGEVVPRAAQIDIGRRTAAGCGEIGRARDDGQTKRALHHRGALSPAPLVSDRPNAPSSERSIASGSDEGRSETGGASGRTSVSLTLSIAKQSLTMSDSCGPVAWTMVSVNEAGEPTFERRQAPSPHASIR